MRAKSSQAGRCDHTGKSWEHRVGGGYAGCLKNSKLLRTWWSEQAMMGGKGSPRLERTAKESGIGGSELENRK